LTNIPFTNTLLDQNQDISPVLSPSTQNSPGDGFAASLFKKGHAGWDATIRISDKVISDLKKKLGQTKLNRKLDNVVRDIKNIIDATIQRFSPDSVEQPEPFPDVLASRKIIHFNEQNTDGEFSSTKYIIDGPAQHFSSGQGCPGLELFSFGSGSSEQSESFPDDITSSNKRIHFDEQNTDGEFPLSKRRKISENPDDSTIQVKRDTSNTMLAITGPYQETTEITITQKYVKSNDGMFAPTGIICIKDTSSGDTGTPELQEEDVYPLGMCLSRAFQTKTFWAQTSRPS